MYNDEIARMTCTAHVFAGSKLTTLATYVLVFVSKDILSLAEVGHQASPHQVSSPCDGMVPDPPDACTPGKIAAQQREFHNYLCRYST